MLYSTVDGQRAVSCLSIEMDLFQAFLALYSDGFREYREYSILRLFYMAFFIKINKLINC